MNTKTRAALFFCILSAFHFSSSAQDNADTNPDSQPLDIAPVHVIGSNQGPPILEFVRDDVMVAVLGEMRPIQKNIDVYTTRVERQVAASQVVLGARGVVVGEGIGVLRGLTLWSSIRKVRFLGDGQTLSDLVPAQDYALWLELKEKYLPDDDNVEKLKPMYAAWKLYEAAIKHNRLDLNVPSRPLIRRTARSNRIPSLDARYHLRIANPKVAIREFGVDESDDLGCFQQTIHHLEQMLDQAPEAGRAWAEGNIQTLSELTDAAPAVSACWAHLTNTSIARQQGVDLEQSMDAAWLAGLRDAASRYKVIFTTVPVRDLLHSQGAIRLLLNEGFAPRTLPTENDGALSVF